MTTRPCTYQVIVQGKTAATPQHSPIIIQEQVPTDLCMRAAASVRTRRPLTASEAARFREYMTGLLLRHDPDLMAMQAWSCWNCSKKATSITHNPMSYLHEVDDELEGPRVVDWCFPVCENRAGCDMLARRVWSEEMAQMGVPECP